MDTIKLVPFTNTAKDKVERFYEAAFNNYQSHLCIIQHLTLVGAMSKENLQEAQEAATNIWECNKGLIETYKNLLN